MVVQGCLDDIRSVKFDCLNSGLAAYSDFLRCIVTEFDHWFGVLKLKSHRLSALGLVK